MPSLPRRVIAAVVALTLAANPLLVIADRMDDAIADGQLAGDQFRGNFMPAYDEAAGTITIGAGVGAQVLDLESLYGPEYGVFGATSADIEATYGDDLGAMGLGANRQVELSAENSAEGDAYRAVLGTANLGRPDLNVDAVWQQSADVFDNPSLFAGFDDCDTVPELQPTQTLVHVPEFRYCDRSGLVSGVCNVLHWFEFGDIVPPFAISTVSLVGAGGDTGPSVSVTSCGLGCTEIELTTGSVGFAVNGDEGEVETCRATTSSYTFSINRPSAIKSATISRARLDTDGSTYERFSAQIDGAGVYSGPGGVFACQLVGVDKQTHSVNPGVDVTAQLKAAPVHTLQLSTEDTADWTGTGIRNSVMLRVYWQTGTREILGEHWQVDPECAEIWDKFPLCPDSTSVCNDTFTVLPGVGYDVGFGAIFREVEMDPAPFDLHAYCTDATLTLDCDNVHPGDMECWTDPQGEVHCPFNDADNFVLDEARNELSNCSALEEDPACHFVGARLVEDSPLTRSGQGVIRESIYDCGLDLPVGDAEITYRYDCGGAPIRCLGGDCMDTTRQRSDSFNQVLAALNATDEIADDGVCDTDDPAACEIFKGETLKCKKAIFGIVNCCKGAAGVSLADYMELYMATSELDDLLGTGYLDPTENAAEGAWNMLADGAANVYNTVTSELFTSSGESATSIASSVPDLSAALATLEQQAFRAGAEFVNAAFGEQAANLMFALEGGGEAVSGGAVEVGNLTWAAGMETLITALSWVMTIYTIVTVLIQIIWECEESEFELGAKKEFRLCHYVGTYCSSRALFVCIEKKQSYCCFNSPLARIMQEQVRAASGIGWGSAKSPDCGGLTLAELQGVNWNLMDLSEWIGILRLTNHLPSPTTVNLERLTGAGSVLDMNMGTRTNAPDRTRDRQLEVTAGRGDSYNDIYQDALDGAEVVVPPLP